MKIFILLNYKFLRNNRIKDEKNLPFMSNIFSENPYDAAATTRSAWWWWA